MRTKFEYSCNRKNEILDRRVKKKGKNRGEKGNRGNRRNKEATDIRNGISMSTITVQHGRLNSGLACDFQPGIIFLDETLRRDPGNGQLRRASCCSPRRGHRINCPGKFKFERDCL